MKSKSLLSIVFVLVATGLLAGCSGGEVHMSKDQAATARAKKDARDDGVRDWHPNK